MTPKEIWILEDDQGAQFVYEEILGLRYHVKIFDNLNHLRDGFLDLPDHEKRPDLVIADIRLPGESFLRYLMSDDSKPVFPQIPFIVVSSVDDVDALRLCFDRGAADYLTKPFGKSELVVKVENILSGKTGHRKNHPFTINPETLTVHRNGQTSEPLTSKEFQIISLMDHSESKSISRQEITTKVWSGVLVSTKTLDVHLHNLRKKLEKLGIEIKFVNPNLYRIQLRDGMNS